MTNFTFYGKCVIIYIGGDCYGICTTSNNYYNCIRSKSIDFVITEDNGKIRLCIELDDATHNYNSRIERDNFVNYIFKQSNLKLLRIPVQDFYNLEDLERKITEF